MKLPDKVYDVLKWVCLICLPAAAWGYDALGELWGFPYVDRIPQSINIVATILGILIGVSTLNYNKDQGE